jgi:hypothetical protein
MEFRAAAAERERSMKEEHPDQSCPRCGYPLVPVHAVEGRRRQVIAFTCPEPYCDHMQMVPRGGTARPRGEIQAAS